MIWKYDILKVAIDAGDIKRIGSIIKSHGLNFKENWYGGYAHLYYSITVGHTECVEEMLKAGAEIHHYIPGKMEPVLHAAVFTDSKKILKLILDRKPQINVKNGDGETALHFAIKHRRPECVRMLLEYNADPNCMSQDGLTPLQLAILVQHVDIVQILIDHGADLHNEDHIGKPFHLAASVGHKHILMHFMNRGIDINSTDQEGSTVLHHLCKVRKCDLQHVTTCSFLMDVGANVNIKDNRGHTCLFYAVKYKLQSLVKVLLRKQFDLSDKEKRSILRLSLKQDNYYIHMPISEMLIRQGFSFGKSDAFNKKLLYLAVHGNHARALEEMIKLGTDVETIVKVPISRKRHHLSLLQTAARSFSIDVTKVLLRHGANVHVKDRDNRTLLFLAIRDCTGTVEELLKYGIDVNAVAKDGATVLHYAAAQGDVDMIEVLLKHKANVNCRTKLGETPLHCAAAKGRLHVIPVLIQYGAEVDARMTKNLTPLHVAEIGMYPNSAATLMKYGADINAQDDYGRTTLHIVAAQGGSLRLRRLLLQGADATIMDRSGATAINIMSQYAHDPRRQYGLDIFHALNQELEALMVQFDFMVYTGLDDDSSERNDEFVEEHSDCEYFCECKAIIESTEHIMNYFYKYMDISQNREKILKMSREELEGILTSETAHQILVKLAREVIYMRDEEISGGVTIYDVINKNYVDLARLMDDERFVINMNIYKNRVVYYRYLLTKQIRAAEYYRKEYVFEYELHRILNGALPEVVVRHIKNYLSRSDLCYFYAMVCDT